MSGGGGSIVWAQVLRVYAAVCAHTSQGVYDQSISKASWLLCLGSRALWTDPEAVPADDDLGVSRLFGRQCQDAPAGLEREGGKYTRGSRQ